MSKAIIAFLQGLMRRRGQPPSQLAAHLGVSHTSVSRWLSGKDKPSVASCVKIATYAGVPLERLLYLLGYVVPVGDKKAAGLPDFREYAKRKYPRVLDEDLIILIEDLIECRSERIDSSVRKL